MSVQAKMIVRSVETPEWSDEVRQVEMTAIMDTEDTSKTWSRYTPSGTVKLNITNPAAFEQFSVNRVFLLTFEDVTPSAAK